jgi:hypothetical protein
MALRAQMIQARRGPPPLVVSKGKEFAAAWGIWRATLRDGAIAEIVLTGPSFLYPRP